jgi:CelD/BcsL family acetyltransferase involved in cellulose biosynthesis
MSVRLVQTNEEFRNLRKDWNHLLAQSTANTIFLTWDWLWAWWHAYAKAGDRLCILLVRDSGSVLAGILPLYLRRTLVIRAVPIRCLRFIGEGSSDSDYLDLIALPGRENGVLSEAWGFLKSHRPHWDVLELTCIPESSSTMSWLRTLCAAENLLSRRATIPCAVTMLPESWDRYLASLKPRFRTKVRTTLRRLQEEHRVRFYSIDNHQDVDSALLVLYELHGKRWAKRDQKGVFLSPAKQIFYRTFSKEFIKQGWLAFDFLALDGRPVACQLCFRYNDALFLLQEGFDPDYESESVGIALRAMVLRKAIEQGIKRYDFLAGTGRHKSQWEVSIINCESISIGRRTVRSSIYLKTPELVENGKDLLRTLLPQRLLDMRRKLLAPR